MARFTEAYSDLIDRMTEVEALCETAKQYSKLPPTPSNIKIMNGLCRAGVVMLSSHLEAYIEQLASTALERIHVKQIEKNKLDASFRVHITKTLINDIKTTQNPVSLAAKIERLFREGEDVWSLADTYRQPIPTQDFIDAFSNPKHNKIKEFFARFGYKNYEGDLGSRLESRYQACKNMIDQIVDQRNAIAHGDYTTVGSPTSLSEMISISKVYCRETDGAVGDWFKNIGCSIR